MKYYIFLFSIILMSISCGNPKEEIVNQQIQIKSQLDSMHDPDMDIKFYMRQISNKKRDSIYEKEFDTLEMAENRADLERAIQEKVQYDSERRRLLKQYDSLEMELKKY